MDDLQQARDAQALAEATAKAMFERDQATQSLGMQIVKMGPGYAQLTMTVRPDMLNGHQTCHGGFIFALADSAFAFSCNSYNRNTVASGCSIDYLAPGYAGDVLTAEASEQSRAGRTGVYDITVSNQAGIRIALFRGKSYQISGEVLKDTV
ncbi:acyl-CoA thioesterase [Collimonas sp. OK242]|uniref:hydroxyphenylacetyl-CoA thioesterase PaaI n=1 Tax=Collimonas sp. OK242 TaxID=1798195 RepID=UPI0008984443|nr:hydroxyphenylacetyl-CoA thioesterase PaaI [Collimonas sp. OK242]SDX71691.1 acyl-CoA thioesterase [Collimonas sp. OK242]